MSEYKCFSLRKKGTNDRISLLSYSRGSEISQAIDNCEINFPYVEEDGKEPVMTTEILQRWRKSAVEEQMRLDDSYDKTKRKIKMYRGQMVSREDLDSEIDYLNWLDDERDTYKELLFLFDFLDDILSELRYGNEKEEYELIFFIA